MNKKKRGFFSRGPVREPEKEPPAEPEKKPDPPPQPEKKPNAAGPSGLSKTVVPPRKSTEPPMQMNPSGSKWKSASTPAASPSNTSPTGVARLSKEISFKGELRGTGSVEIDGRFEGSVILEHTLRILQNGDVKADVEADEVEIVGKLVGDVVARKKISIAKGGQMFGNIKAHRVVVNDGAVFKGHMDMQTGSIESKPGVEPAKPAAAPVKPVESKPVPPAPGTAETKPSETKPSDRTPPPK